jgi:GntR family transcriptional regulator
MTLRDLAAVYRHDKPQLTLIEQSSAMPRLRAADGKPAPRYHFMRRVHSRDGKAYCVISIYIDQRVFRKAAKRFRTETVIPVLLEIPRLKIAHASQTLAIGTADLEVAEYLGVAVNTPVAEVRRVCTAPDGTVIYLGEVTYRGDFVRIEMDLRP